MFKKPVMYFRDSILFPNIKDKSLLIGRLDSINAIDLALKNYEGEIAIITQMFGENEYPAESELLPVGTICKIVKSLNFSDGTRKILIEGQNCFNVKKIIRENDVNMVEGVMFNSNETSEPIADNDKFEIISLLKAYNPDWNKNEEKLNKYFNTALTVTEFIQKSSELIASPYTGVQKKAEFELIKRDLNYWKQISRANIDDINARVRRRAVLLTALPAIDKLNLLKAILRDESAR